MLQKLFLIFLGSTSLLIFFGYRNSSFRGLRDEYFQNYEEFKAEQNENDKKNITDYSSWFDIDFLKICEVIVVTAAGLVIAYGYLKF